MTSTITDINIYQVNVPVEVLRSLSDEARYTYFILGHMFNELIFLQKLLGFAFPKHTDDAAPRLQPEMAQVFFLFRMSSAKVWEASKTLSSAKVKAVLASTVLPLMKDGARRLQDLEKAVEDAPWLRKLRNGLGFHFPSFGQWKEHSTPGPESVDDIIYLSDLSGNAFYRGSASIAHHWMFEQFNSSKIDDAVEPMLLMMGELLLLFNTFIEDAIAALVGRKFLKDAGTRFLLGTTSAPRVEDVNVPFWVAMPPKNSKAPC